MLVLLFKGPGYPQDQILPVVSLHVVGSHRVGCLWFSSLRHCHFQGPWNTAFSILITLSLEQRISQNRQTPINIWLLREPWNGTIVCSFFVCMFACCLIFLSAEGFIIAYATYAVYSY